MSALGQKRTPGRGCRPVQSATNTSGFLLVKAGTMLGVGRERITVILQTSGLVSKAILD